MLIVYIVYVLLLLFLTGAYTGCVEPEIVDVVDVVDVVVVPVFLVNTSAAWKLRIGFVQA